MANTKILVAYGSRAGSTAEIAEFIGAQLRAAGMQTDVKSVREVQDLSAYSVLVLGTATRIARPLGEVLDFARRNAERLQQIPVAYFVVGIAMREDTPTHRRDAETVLEPLRKLKAPISEGLFAGRVEYARIEQPWRFLISHDKEGQMREGDWRDWESIREWAESLAQQVANLNSRESA